MVVLGVCNRKAGFRFITGNRSTNCLHCHRRVIWTDDQLNGGVCADDDDDDGGGDG